MGSAIRLCTWLDNIAPVKTLRICTSAPATSSWRLVCAQAAGHDRGQRLDQGDRHQRLAGIGTALRDAGSQGAGAVEQYVFFFFFLLVRTYCCIMSYIAAVGFRNISCITEYLIWGDCKANKFLFVFGFELTGLP